MIYSDDVASPITHFSLKTNRSTCGGARHLAPPSARSRPGLQNQASLRPSNCRHPTTQTHNPAILSKMNTSLKDHIVGRILPNVQQPAQYLGGEREHRAEKITASVRGRLCLAFPDTYTIGMSHHGLQLLYALMNRRDDWVCERCFTPWEDMEQQLRQSDLPLYSLESFTPLHEFDVLGFSLQYEICATNLLTMLDLGRIPLRSTQRGMRDPLVIAGGPCARIRNLSPRSWMCSSAGMASRAYRRFVTGGCRNAHRAGQQGPRRLKMPNIGTKPWRGWPPRYRSATCPDSTNQNTVRVDSPRSTAHDRMCRKRSNRWSCPTWTRFRCRRGRSCHTSSACTTESRSRLCAVVPGSVGSAKAQPSNAPCARERSKRS